MESFWSCVWKEIGAIPGQIKAGGNPAIIDDDAAKHE
jgi:hypothetical protein